MFRKLSRYLSVTGRMPRSVFWKFAALWLPLVVVVLMYVAPDLQWIWYIDNFLWVIVLMIPAFTTAHQRIKDTREHGRMAWSPIVPFANFYCVYVGILLIFFGPAYLMAQHGGGWTDAAAIGSAGVGVFFGVILYFLFYPAVILAGIATLMCVSQVLGQCLVPSISGSNTYGPNPNEVTP
ncbi:hypothetical protein [Sulfitobacter sp.]|uniref:hypothetical protein n=1 Tax=Sulfitobacter sp. TaxID=1903071 RepID=UPI0030012CBC